MDSFSTVDSLFLRNPAHHRAASVDTFYARGGVTPDGRKCKKVYKLLRSEPLRKNRLICDLGKDAKADRRLLPSEPKEEGSQPAGCAHRILDLSAAQRNEQAILNFNLCYFAMRDAVYKGSMIACMCTGKYFL